MTAASRQGKKQGWLVRFLLRAIVVVATIHYLFLVLLFHGMAVSVDDASKNILAYMDVPIGDVLGLAHFQSRRKQNLQGNQIGSHKTETTPRLLWVIESTASDQGLQRRKTIRETSLTSRGSSKEHQEHTDEPLFCSLRGLENGTFSMTTTCHFVYVFVIPDDSYSGPSVEEPDTISWRKDDAKEMSSWLTSVQSMGQKYQWKYIGWLNDMVVVVPLEILDLVGLSYGANTGSDERSHVVFETPENPMTLMCGGKCSLDKDMLQRTGKIFIMPYVLLESANDLERPACSRSSGQDVARTLRICLTGSQNSLGNGKRVITQRIGHQYAHTDVSEYRSLWEQHLKMVQFYNRLQRRHKVHYISAKFNRDPSRYVNEFRDLRSALMYWGFQSSQIYLYDGVFPEFIVNNHRWEQHVEFLHDNDITDLGAGFWFWKAPLLEHHLNLLDEGDFVIFSNVEYWNHLPWLSELLETMMSRQANMASYHNFFPENQWTKRELYELLCSHIPERYMPNDRSNQYMSHFMVFRKSPGTMDFIRRFTRLAANYHLISDEPSILPEYPEFREHRRDQSIISLLLKCQYQDSGKELFFQPALKELGWFDAFTFHLNPLSAR